MLLKQSTLTAALKAYRAGQRHALMHADKPCAVRHPDGRNLYLNVTATGAMSWLFMYVKDGKRHERGLGSFTGEGRATCLTLEQARIEADKFRVAIMNPDYQHASKPRKAAEKKAQLKSGTTFADMFKIHADACIAGKVWKRGEAERYHWSGQLNKNAKALMDMPVDDITTEDVVTVLKPVWPSRLGEQMAQRIRAIFNTAKLGHGHLVGKDNPANVVALKAILKGQATTEGHAQLPFAKLPGFLAALLAGGSIAELCVAFIALTAVRGGEARQAKWSEVDGNRWTIPAERMGKSAKSGKAKPHVVTLPKQAIAILARLPKDSEYLFPIRGGCLSGNDLIDVVHAHGLKDETTVHGLRKTFRTHMGEKHDANGNLTYQPQLLEFCLAHVLKGSEAAYMSGTAINARGIILQAYADEVFGMMSNVVELKAAA